MSFVYDKCAATTASIILLMMAFVLGFPAPANATTYANNTACAEGIYLRRLSKPPTDKWYMVTPLERNQDSQITLPLIAGNCMIIGQVDVNQQADGLTVTVQYLEGVTVHEELLMVYTDLADIQELEHGHLETPYRLGQPIALSALGNPSFIWLYVNNRVSFTDNLPGLATYASQSLQHIHARIELARAAGLGEKDYLEQLPLSRPLQQTDMTGIPDENGCIDGVCPVPTFQMPANWPTLPSAP